MTTSTRVEELLRLEYRFWDAMKRKDGDAARAMTAPKCVVVGAQGVSAIDRDTMARLTVEGQWQLEEYSIDPATVQTAFVDENTAVVAYKVSERVRIDGEEIMLEANDASVWVRDDGNWLCSLHTESLSGDPFGRDRR